ncbi:MAG: regulatory protein RecX [Bacteroidota bacterium]
MARIEQSLDKNIDRTVVSIKAARKRGKCFVVFSNEDYILLEKDLIYEFKIAKDLSISSDIITLLLRREELIEAKKKGLQYATYALRSSLQVFKKLSHLGYNKDTIENVIQFLKDFNYLSDEIFAIQYTKAKIQRKHYGYQRIKRELELKGIAQDIISNTLKDHYPEVIVLDTARMSAEKKLRSVSFRSEEKKRAQLYAHLVRQGFPKDIISQIMKEYT